jgi:hypothetical protein
MVTVVPNAGIGREKPLSSRIYTGLPVSHVPGKGSILCSTSNRPLRDERTDWVLSRQRIVKCLNSLHRSHRRRFCRCSEQPRAHHQVPAFAAWNPFRRLHARQANGPGGLPLPLSARGFQPNLVMDATFYPRRSNGECRNSTHSRLGIQRL